MSELFITRSKSGRGTTRHQKARESIPLHFEGGQARMVKKFPLLRGKGRNKSYGRKPLLLTLNHLNKFDNDAAVSIKVLIKKNIINGLTEARGVKILNQGKLKKKLTVQLPVSSAVKKAIEDLGGKVIPVEK